VPTSSATSTAGTSNCDERSQDIAESYRILFREIEPVVPPVQAEGDSRQDLRRISVMNTLRTDLLDPICRSVVDFGRGPPVPRRRTVFPKRVLEGFAPGPVVLSGHHRRGCKELPLPPHELPAHRYASEEEAKLRPLRTPQEVSTRHPEDDTCVTLH